MFKYANEHNGIDALACYGMDITPDPRMVTNPARLTARKKVTAARSRTWSQPNALPQLLNSGQTPKQLNAALPGATNGSTRRRDVPVRQSAFGTDPSQDPRPRPGPRRQETSPPGPPRPANGAPAPRVQRRSLAQLNTSTPT